MQLRILAVVALFTSAAASACSSSTASPSGSQASVAEPAPEEAAAATEPEANLTAFSQAEVQAIFNVRCVKCHDADSSNVDLSAPFTRNTIGVPTGGPTGKTVCGRASDVALRIAPGDRNASLLFQKVKGTQDCGSKMPYDRGNKPLDANELERLGLYIDALAAD